MKIDKQKSMNMLKATISGILIWGIIFSILYSFPLINSILNPPCDPCNDLSFYPPLKEERGRIEKELREHYGHPVWLHCGGDSIGENTNIFWSREGDMIDCKMMCSLYHRTEWYYTPVYFWFEFNYSDYKAWDDKRRLS